MKIVRYFLCAFLLTITLTFGCEHFQLYIYGFQGPYITSFYTQPNITKEKMLTEIENTAKRYGVGVVLMKSEIKSNWMTETTLFCTPGMETYFENYYHMKEGMHQSVFSGKSLVVYKAFSELSEEELEQYAESYFLIGNEEQVMDFKAALVEKYGGKIPYLDGTNSLKDSITSLLLLWGIIIAIILSTTYYNIIVMKKEFFVKITLGESPFHIIMKNILCDLVFLVMVFGVNLFVLNRICGTIFLLSYSVGCFVVLCIVNSLLYCTLFRLDVKLYNSGIKSSKKLLLINYCMKFVLTFLICVSLASNLFFVQRYIEMVKQKPFYEQRKDYFFVQLIEDNDNEYYVGYDDLEGKLYKEFYKNFSIQVNELYSAGFDTTVFVNSNMKSYLLEKITLKENDIKEVLGKNEAILFLPEDHTLTEEEIDDFSSDLAFYSENEELHVAKVYYQDNVTWNVYDGELGYTTINNPIILYSGKECWEMENAGEYGGTLFIRQYQAFMKIDEKVLEQFCKENNCRYTTSNVYEDFMQILHNYKKGATLNIILLMIQFVIQLILIMTVIKLEFESNRLELVIKKILGYSKLERFRRLYLVTILSCVLCMLCILGAQCLLKIPYLNLAYIGAFVLLVIELCIISILFIRQEKENIQKTLKGGYL